MLMNWLESRMTLVWLVYFSIAELLSLGPSQAPSCILISEEARSENYTGNYACASMHEAIFRFVQYVWRHAGHDNIIAFGTILIAVFTYVLYRSTDKLWAAAQEQARITENAFAQLEGPLIEGCDLKLDLIQGQIKPGDSPPTIKMLFKNRGRGPGFIIKICTRFVRVKRDAIPEIPQYGNLVGLSNMTLASGEKTESPLEITLEPSNDTEPKILFFYGYIQYKGIFGGVNTWAWGYAPVMGGTFEGVGGRAYNYRKYEPDRK
jgi:hypothetical protein